ncbi:cysteine hydrolase family protein [Ancylobacter terrae]|uniref:cysteine hydrolase family protein n=1 Tax=Ancylobacter sp. sgz301288 TaxID=3342077 RepID=UPI00385DD999
MLTVNARPYAWPHTADLVPRTTALIIVDMQRDFCEPGGYIDTMGYDVAPAQALIPRIQALRQAVRDWGGFVIYTREGHRGDLTDLLPQKRFRSRVGGGEIGSAGPLGRLLIRGEAGWDIVQELAPVPGEPVIDKPGFSSFYATDLDRLLVTRGVRHLLVCGVTTDVCVHSTIRDAVDRGYEPLLISDCCAATVKANHIAAIDSICAEGGIFGAAAPSGEVIEALGGQRDGRAAAS